MGCLAIVTAAACTRGGVRTADGELVDGAAVTFKRMQSWSVDDRPFGDVVDWPDAYLEAGVGLEPDFATTTQPWDPYYDGQFNYAFDRTASGFDGIEDEAVPGGFGALFSDLWYRVDISKPGYDRRIAYRPFKYREACQTYDAEQRKYVDTLCNEQDFVLNDAGSCRSLWPDLTLDRADIASSVTLACPIIDTPSGPAQRFALRADIAWINAGDAPFMVFEDGARSKQMSFTECPGTSGSVGFWPVLGEFCHTAYSWESMIEDFFEMRLVRADDACANYTSATRDPSCIVRSVRVGSRCDNDITAFDADIAAQWEDRTVRPPAVIVGCNHRILTPGFERLQPERARGQYLDVTGLAPGAYLLEVEIDPDHRFEELSGDCSPETCAWPADAPRDNNVVQVRIELPASCDRVEDCTGASPSRYCEQYLEPSPAACD